MSGPVSGALSAAAQEARFRAAHAISLSRADASLSLTQAARDANTTVRTVRRRIFHPAVVRSSSHRFAATR